MKEIGYSLRPATGADAPNAASLVEAAYEHYVGRIGMLPRPMTEEYAEVIEDRRVTVAERRGVLAGVIVLDDSLVLQNAADMTEALRSLAGEGYPLKREEVARLSPYLTEHVKRFGDYVANLEAAPAPLDGAMPDLDD